MLEAPSVGAGALGASNGAESSTPQSSPQPSPSRARRPSEFQPNYGAPESEPAPAEQRARRHEDPSRVEKQLGGEAAGDPRTSDDGLRTENEQEPAAEPEVDTPDPEHQALAEKFLKQLKGGAIQIEDFKNLQFEWKLPNGSTIKATPEQLVAGNLRQSDYTRKLIDAQKMHGQAQNLIQLETQRRQQWRNPQALVQGLTQMGLEEAFVQAVDMHVQQELQFRKLPPDRKAQIQYERRLAQMDAEYQSRIQQYEQQLRQAGQPDVQATTEQYYQQIMPAMDAAFKRLNIPPKNAFAQQEFVKALEIRFSMGSGQLTQEMIDDAAESVADIVEDKRAAIRLANEALARQGRNGGALPPRRMAGAPGQTVSTNGKRSRPSDFAGRFNHTGF